MQTRTRKIKSDIQTRLGRTILAALSIAIGVFGVTLLVSANDILLTALDEGMPPEEIAMLKVFTTLPNGQISLAENQSYLESLAALPNVTEVQGQAIYDTTWRTTDEPAYTDSYLYAYTTPYDDMLMEGNIDLKDGVYPQAGQVAIDVRVADKYDVAIGDTLWFRNPSGEEIDLQVSGLVLHQFVTLGGSSIQDIPHEESFFTTYNDAQQITGFGGLNSIYVRYTDYETAQVSVPEFMNAVATETPYVPFFSWLEDPDSSYMMGQVSGVTDVLNVLAILSMVVSGFLVINVINTIIVEQKQQIGVLKSLGGSRWDVFFIYAGMATTYGVLGTMIGVAVGVPAAATMAEYLAPFALTYVDGFQISMVGIGAAIILGIFVPIIISIVPVYLGTRVTILDAMTDFGISSAWGTGWQARLIKRLPVPLVMRQALSNIAQKKARLALTGFTLTLAMASFMGVVALLITLDEQIDGFFDDLPYDVLVVPNQPQDFETFSTLLQSEVEGVGNVYPGYSVAGDLEGYVAPNSAGLEAGTSQIILSGIDPASGVVTIDLLAGDGWVNDTRREGVVITNAQAQQLEKTVGDTLFVTVNGQVQELEILGVRDSLANNVLIRWDTLAVMAGYVDSSGNPIPSTYYVGLKASDPTLANIDEAIEMMEMTLASQGIQASYENRLENQAEQAEFVQVFGIIFGIMSGVMAAVGAIGLLAALSMAVLERLKEIGVLRSIGASSMAILSQFLVEGLLVGLIAWVIALPFSMLLGGALLGSLPFDGVIFEYSLLAPLVGFVGVIVMSIVASLLPALSAANKTVSDILRYQ